MQHAADFSASDLNCPVLPNLVGIDTTPVGTRSFYARFAKRPLDLLALLVSAPIVIPVVAILALVILFHGGKPFYSQMRVGQSGRGFRLWKLRTMVENADQCLTDYLATNPEAKAEWDLTQKLKRDPRITGFGRFLRKSSLDELPQLWNVFRGEMSIVGPRPMMVDQACLYPGADYYYLRPGVTGLWQISDRNDSTFAERATFDATYAAELSLRQDVEIIARTVGVVVRCTGY